MTTIEKLRDELASTVTKLQDKKISAEEAMAISRAAAAVIGSLRVEISYRKARVEKPEIKYFEQSGNESSSPKKVFGNQSMDCGID